MPVTFFCARVGLAALALALGFGPSVCRALVLPALANAPAPTPEPAAPVGWDVFTPPEGPTAAVAGTPTIAEWTRTGGPDDSLILTGDLLSNFTAAAEGADTQFLVYGQTSTGEAVQTPALIQRLDGAKAALTLPSTLPAWSTYFIWPKNFNGYGNPVALNRTDLWWLNPDNNVTREDTVSAYGRNLSHGGGTASAWIYLKPVGNASGQWVTPTTVNPYRVQFTVPTSLANGTYEVWAHNGHGGRHGWSGPLLVTVTDAYGWNGNTFNVRDYGAIGDGVTDDSDAIGAANDAASACRDRTGLHPTLYFPGGIYMVRHGVCLGRDMRYLGDGRDGTILKCNPGFTQPRRDGDPLDGSLGLLYSNGGRLHDVEVRGLTLDAVGDPHGASEEAWALNGMWDSGTDIRFTDLRIKANNTQGCARTHATKRLSVAGCEFIGGEFFLYHDDGVEIRNCTFLNADYQMASVHELTVSNFSITDCRFQDLDPGSHAGRGQGRLLAGNANQGAQYHAYIGDNVTVALGPDPGDNAGEQVLCEGNLNTYDWGQPAAARPNAVTFVNKLTTDYRTVAATAVVTAGKGLGQYRLITGSDGDRTITVSPNWNVTPDATSVVLIEAGTYQWVVYHNTFEGKSHYATAYSAMTAIEPFGGCYDWVGDRNTITNMRSALSVCAVQDLVSLQNRIHPCFFHLYSNNVIKSCYRGIQAACGSTGSSTVDPGVGFVGTIFRNNVMTDIVAAGIAESTTRADGSATLGIPLDMTLFEHNVLADLPQGFDFAEDGPGRVKNTVLYKNVFTRGTATLAGSFGVNIAATTLDPVFAGNTWTGFETTNKGVLTPLNVETPSTVGVPSELQIRFWIY